MYPHNASTATGKDTFRGIVRQDTLRIILGVSWRDEVKKLMKAKRVTQVDLVPVLGVTTRGAVGHYLSGRRDMTPEQFYALLKYLGVGAKDVFEPSTGPDPQAIARTIESLPPESQVTLQKVADSFVKSAQLNDWDEKRDPDRRRKAG